MTTSSHQNKALYAAGSSLLTLALINILAALLMTQLHTDIHGPLLAMGISFNMIISHTLISTRAGIRAMATVSSWYISLGLVTVVLIYLSVNHGLTWLSTIRLAIAVITICLLIDQMTAYVSRQTRHTDSAPIISCMILLIFTSTPIWIAPWVSISENESLSQVSIAISPMTYLASMADFDYLRSPWCYENLPYGGLRYNYPNPWLVTMVYIVLAFIFSLLEKRTHQHL